MDIDPRHLHELWRIAQESDPEAWCDEASDFGSQYLRGAGIPATTDYDDERTDEYGEPVKTGFLGTTHSWIRLKDGTIIDPTVSQFSNMVDGWPHHPEVPNVAVVPPGHPFANNYVGSEDYSLPTDYQDTPEGRVGASDPYMTGQCAALAVALQKRAGGQIVGIGYDDSAEDYDAWQADPRWEHFGLELPDGRVLDIEGVHKDLDDFMARHNYYEARDFTPEEAVSLPYYPKQDVEAADAAAQQVLQGVGIHEAHVAAIEQSMLSAINDG